MLITLRHFYVEDKTNQLHEMKRQTILRTLFQNTNDKKSLQSLL